MATTPQRRRESAPRTVSASSPLAEAIAMLKGEGDPARPAQLIVPEKRRPRRWRRWLLLLALAGAALLAKGYWNATRDPVIRTASVEDSPTGPADQPPLRLLLLSDIHVAGPDMPPERVERIVGALNRLKPDPLVLIAGDLVSEKGVADAYLQACGSRGAASKDCARRWASSSRQAQPWTTPSSPMRCAANSNGAGLRVLQNEAVEAGPAGPWRRRRRSLGARRCSGNARRDGPARPRRASDSGAQSRHRSRGDAPVARQHPR